MQIIPTIKRIALCIVCCLVSIVLQAQQIPSSGLVAHWPFTGNANDAAGTHHGNPNNVTPTQGKMGIGNTAYLFNSVNDYIGVPYQSDMNLPTISICVIFRPDGFYSGPCQGNYILSRGAEGTTASYIACFYDNPYNSCQVLDTNLHVVHAPMGNILPAPSNFQSTPKIHTGSWYCFVATYDGTTAKYYLNGSHILSYSGWNMTGTSTDSICIGKYSWGGPSFPYNFTGAIDDIAIYNRALTATEVDSYCTNAPKVGIPVDSGDTNVNIRYIDDLPNKVGLYPNPNNGRFTINGTLNSTTAELVIYNMVGTVINKSVVAVKGTVMNNEIDISSLPEGMYMLRIVAGDYTENIRFVKKE